MLLANAPMPEEASSILLHHTPTMLHMLRALPYVPVLAGRLLRDLFPHIGRDMITLGRARMLDRLSLRDDLSPEAKAFTAAWSLGLGGHPTVAGRWALAQTQGN